MKVLLIVLLAMVCSGCWVYGDGKEACYISSVEDGIFWAHVFTKTDLSSSDADDYMVKKDNEPLRNEIYSYAEKKTRVRIKYKKHLVTAGGNGDEIISVEEIK